MKNLHHTRASCTGGRLLHAVALSVLLAIGVMAPRAQAATYTWTGAGADNNWTTPENWQGDSVPVTNSDIIFTGSARLNINYDVAAGSGTTVRTFTFAADAGPYVMSGNEITVQNTSTPIIFSNSTSHAQTVNADLNFNGTANNEVKVEQAVSGTLVINGAINYNSARFFPQTTPGTLILNGPGTGNNMATTTFAIAEITNIALRNNVNNAVYELGHPEAFSTGALQFNNDATIRAGATLVGANAISNVIAIGAANTLIVGGTNSIEFKGSIYNAGGSRTLRISNTGTTIVSGAVRLSNDTITVRTLTLNVDAGLPPVIFSGSVTNSATAATGVANHLTKAGSGTVGFSGINTYTGTTTISGGAVYLDGTHEPVAPANYASGVYTVASGAALGGSGRIKPSVSGIVTATTHIDVSGTLRPGSINVDPDGDEKIDSALSTLTISQESSTLPVLTMASGASMVFRLGLDHTSTKVKLTGTAPKPVIVNNNVLNFTDITTGTTLATALAVGDYVLIETDGPGCIENLTVDAEGNITGGLVFGSGLENYRDSKLKMVGNNVVASVGLTIYVPLPPVINSQLSVTGTGGVPFSYNITATNFPGSFTASPLPAGLSVNAGTGLISGSPMVSGTFNVTIGVSNAGGSDSTTLTIIIPAGAPQILAKPQIGGMSDLGFDYTIPSAYLPTTHTVSGLPAGLSLDPATGRISGTPTVTGVFVVTITAANAQGSDTKEITIVIEPKSSLTLLAGVPGVSGSADGPSDVATFSLPGGVAGDAQGNLYIADIINNTIRRIAPDGNVTTFAGVSGTVGGYLDGPADEALFRQPIGLAINAAGTTLYVADTLNHAIRKVDLATGDVHTQQLYANMSGVASDRLMQTPYGVAFDAADNLYIANAGARTIHKVDLSTGITTVIAGQWGAVAESVDGIGADARFACPSGIALDPSGAWLYIADSGTTQRITESGTTEISNSTIRRITLATGAVDTIAGNPAESGSADGSTADARLNRPITLAVDAGGCIYVADYNNHAIRRIDPIGKTVGTVAGLAGVFGWADGFGVNARLRGPIGIGFDAAGELYVLDSYNRVVRVLQVTPLVVTQPASLTVTAGETVTLRVGVSGAPLPSYQWYKNAAAITSATNATLVIEDARQTDAGSYSVVSTNPMGTVQSSTATLTVNPATSGTAGTGGSGGGSGGGGAPGILYFIALGALTLLKRRKVA